MNHVWAYLILADQQPRPHDVKRDQDGARRIDPPHFTGGGCTNAAGNRRHVGQYVVPVILRKRQHGVAFVLQGHAIEPQHNLGASGCSQNQVHHQAHVKLWQNPCSTDALFS